MEQAAAEEGVPPAGQSIVTGQQRARPLSWLSATGADKLREQSQFSYAHYTEAPVDEESIGQILKDLPRTFPGHKRFAVSADPGKDGGARLEPLVFDGAAQAELRVQLGTLPLSQLHGHAISMGAHPSTDTISPNTADELIEMTVAKAGESLIPPLGRILRALVARSPGVGYTQGAKIAPWLRVSSACPFDTKRGVGQA
jgi:hypothetical protein